tara:strand:- start:1865 stop:2068 length:204 start_codon:yes stop_codon:yes gene_type:complete
VGTKKRKYYKFDGTVSKASDNNTVLVKWFEDNTIKISNPFKNKEHAKKECLSYLQKGICSWMVNYDE